MSADDRWTDELRCPKCSREGKATWTELDGWSFARATDKARHVESISDGFKVVQTGRYTQTKRAFCAACDVEAEIVR